MQLYDETTKLNNDETQITLFETWDCQQCVVGMEQAPQPYGARVCRYCGANNQTALVYVMKLETQPFYKIGVAYDILERKRQLQTASPFDIEVLRFYEAEYFDATRLELERMVHKLFQRFHVRREWYQPDDGALVVLLDEKKLFEAIWHYAKFGQVL